MVGGVNVLQQASMAASAPGTKVRNVRFFAISAMCGFHSIVEPAVALQQPAWLLAPSPQR